MSAEATVRVDNDLAAGQAGVAHRTAGYELAAWVYMKDGLLVQVVGWWPESKREGSR